MRIKMEHFSEETLSIQDFLKEHILVTDGAFGTYYAALFDTQELPENANILAPERVKEIHQQYIRAGARLLRTNTYASNTLILGKDMKQVHENIKAACRLAQETIDEERQAGNIPAEEPVFIAGDIGPIPYDSAVRAGKETNEYIEICKTLISCGVSAIVFETFSQMEDILPAIAYVREHTDIFVIVQFAVNQFGYSNAGLSVRKLFTEAAALEGVSAVGLNCGVGPGHMLQIFSTLKLDTDKYITALPNAGYPQNVSNRMIFAADNDRYFAKKTADIAGMGVHIIGGCCGTTPKYIAQLVSVLTESVTAAPEKIRQERKTQIHTTDNAFFAGKPENHKLIAVELAPPLDSDAQKLMEAAHILQKSGVDVLTFPDSPSGRTRADSVLMAEKVRKETGLCVMPHLCCRDKNAIAMRSQLLGANINGINNFLVVTGDPVPSMMRQSVKAVFNFDAIGLMNIMNDMNEDQFVQSPLCYGGAINQNRLHFDRELERVKKKINAGASFFLTQPVFDQAGADKLRRIKNETGARILCGIMPFVSLRNAVFMKNEMTGIAVPDDIISRYEKCSTKQEGEAVGVAIAQEVIAMTQEFADGYYFSFPFNRVYLLEQIKGNRTYF